MKNFSTFLTASLLLASAVNADYYQSQNPNSGSYYQSQDSYQRQNPNRNYQGQNPSNYQGQTRFDNRTSEMNTGSYWSGSGQTGAAAKFKSDQELKKEVQEQLTGNWVRKNYNNVIANVNNGVVVLSGTVANESERQDVMNKIQKVEGVRQVEDHLSISNR